MSRYDPPPRVSSWPQAVVVIAGLITGPAAVVLLVRAGVPIEAIGGFAAVIGGLFASQFAVARRTTEVARQTEAQNGTLASIEHKVNGGLNATVHNAVTQGIADGMEQARNGAPQDGSG